MADRDIAVKFTGDATDLTRASDKAERSLADTSKSMGGSLAGLAGPAGIAAAGIAAVGFVAWDFAQAAMEDEAAAAQLAHQLRQAAGASDEAVAGAEAYIAALSKTVAIADDELRPALSTLATATGDTDKAQRLLALSTDIAAGTGKDLETVANAVAKAQLGSTGALSKLGIATKDAAGETMTLDQVLASAEEKFRGAGEAAAQTSAGGLRNAQIQFGELQEAIGAKLLPILGGLGEIFTTKVIPALESVVAWVEAEWPKIMEQIGPSLNELQEITSEVFANIAAWWAEWGDEVARVAGVIFAFWIQEMVVKLRIFVAVVRFVVDQVKMFWAEYGDEITTMADITVRALTAMEEIVTRVMHVIGFVVRAVSAALSGDWFRAWEEVKGSMAAALDHLVWMLAGLNGRFTDALRGLTDRIVAPFRDAFRTVVDLWNNTIGRLPGASIGGQAVSFAAPTAGALGAVPAAAAAPGPGGFAAAAITIIMPPGSDGYDVARQASTFSRNVAPINNLTIAVR